MTVEIIARVDNMERLLVTLTKDDLDWIRERIYDDIPKSTEKDTAPESLVVLNYRHVPQNGPTANDNRKDCGPAVLASVMMEHGYPHITVNHLSKIYMDYPSQPLNMIKMQQALREHKQLYEYREDIKVEDIAANVQSGRPVIVLLSYEHLPYHPVNYEGGHYILVYAVDTKEELFWYRDPLGDGRELSISYNRLTTAMWEDRKHGNQPYQGILITK